MKVAIMQPTYLPWLGYFSLMHHVDVFVFLDSVQFARRTWQQRNQIKTQNGPAMLTIPVRKSNRREQLIKDTYINTEEKADIKHIKNIQNAYSRAEFFHEYSADIFNIISHRYEKLVDLNLALINYLAKKLSINTKCVRSSGLSVKGHKADLLVDICLRLSADSYISPTGSKVYLDQTSVFSDSGVDLSYHHYEHPEYRQLHGDFVPYMSVIDLLFNLGPNSRDILLSQGSMLK